VGGPYRDRGVKLAEESFAASRGTLSAPRGDVLVFMKNNRIPPERLVPITVAGLLPFPG